MRKRRHHSVWQHYLRAWTQNNRLFCLQGDRIFATGTAQVAVERDLYVLEALSPLEVACARELAGKQQNAKADKKVSAWLDFLMFPGEAVDALCKAGSSPSDPLLFRFLNFGEDFQGHIESSSMELLDALRRRDSSFLKDDRRYAQFLFFLFVQFFRTSKWFEIAPQAELRLPGVRFDRVLKVLSYIYADNVGEYIYCERDKWRLVFLEARCSTSLVTSDQPLFNSVPLPASKEQAPEEFKIFYPVSPQLAIRFSEESQVQNGTVISLSEHETRAYNELVKSNSFRQIFGASREVLEFLAGN